MQPDQQIPSVHALDLITHLTLSTFSPQCKLAIILDKTTIGLYTDLYIYIEINHILLRLATVARADHEFHSLDPRTWTLAHAAVISINFYFVLQSAAQSDTVAHLGLLTQHNSNWLNFSQAKTYTCFAPIFERARLTMICA